MTDTEVLEPDTRPRSEVHVGEPAGEPLMDAVDLVAGYLPGVNILNGASLTLHEGEIVGIIGPNGAGKSTLLKSLFGLVHIHSGKLIFKGKDITNLRADKLVSLGVGFVPQTENVFPSLTIAENLHMAPTRHRSSSTNDSTTCARSSPSSVPAKISSPAPCPAVNARWWRWPAP